MNEQSRHQLELTAAVLLRCWCLGFGLLFVWWIATQLFYKPITSMHSAMFGLTGTQIDIIWYCGLMSLKLSLLILFFIPWLAIRMVLKSRMSESQ